MKNFLTSMFMVLLAVGAIVVVFSMGKTILSGKYDIYHASEKSMDDSFSSNGFIVDLTDGKVWEPANTGVTGVSPHKGTVVFTRLLSRIATDDASREYIALRASFRNSTVSDMRGWSIQSYVSGTRVAIPDGVLFYIHGRDNKSTTPILAPGEFLYLITGRSPLSTSFHTNSCMGKLAESFNFYPDVSRGCPSIASYIPTTVENLRTYGDACLSYLRSMPTCSQKPREVPRELLPTCKAFIEKEVPYNRCVEREFQKSGYAIFNRGGWYTYVNAEADLWRPEHEVLRLLDADGRVVDVAQYY